MAVRALSLPSRILPTERRLPDECLFPSLIARGDSCGMTVTGKRTSSRAADQYGDAAGLEQTTDEQQGSLHIPLEL
jgi:hypothetical protein